MSEFIDRRKEIHELTTFDRNEDDHGWMIDPLIFNLIMGVNYNSLKLESFQRIMRNKGWPKDSEKVDECHRHIIIVMNPKIQEELIRLAYITRVDRGRCIMSYDHCSEIIEELNDDNYNTLVSKRVYKGYHFFSWDKFIEYDFKVPKILKQFSATKKFLDMFSYYRFDYLKLERIFPLLNDDEQYGFCNDTPNRYRMIVFPLTKEFHETGQIREIIKGPIFLDLCNGPLHRSIGHVGASDLIEFGMFYNECIGDGIIPECNEYYLIKGSELKTIRFR